MDNVITVFNGVGWFMGALGAAVSVFFVAYSGFLFISAQGDPQRMAQARTSLIGIAVGLVVIGGAFIIPNTISRFIIEPAGGVPVESRAGFDCDGLLKEQLVFQRTASDPERMQFLVSRIQSQRSDCASESWSPVVKANLGHPNGCLNGPPVKVGDVPVPDGLKTGGGVVNSSSSRDLDNNIIVYWTRPSGSTEAVSLPSDGAICWLYVSDFSAWSESYYSP